MKRINGFGCAFAALTLLWAVTTVASAQGPEEERMVRLAYMKLMYYQSIGLGNRFETEKRSPKPDDLLRFRIGNMKTGMIDEIINRPYGELVTRGLGDVVQIAPVITWWREGGAEYVSYRANWGVGHYTSMEDWQRTPLREVLRAVGSEIGDAVKYTSYEVRVRLEGKERTYRALALFPRRPLATDAQTPVILDMITAGGTMMTKIYNETRPPVYARMKQPEELDPERPDSPDTPIKNAERRALEAEEKAVSPHVPVNLRVENPEQLKSGWLDAPQNPRTRSARSTNDTRLGGCDAGEALCCNYDSGQCCWNPGYYWNPGFFPTCRYESSGGVPGSGGGGGGGEISSAPRCEYREVLGPTRTGPGPDDQYHIIGYHQITSTLTPVCRYYSDCEVDCSHLVDGVSAWDWGLVYSAMSHSINYQVLSPKVGVANGLTSAPTCKAAVGGGVRTCLFGSCGLTISLDLSPFKVEISEGAIWTYLNSSEWTCATATRIN